MTTLRKLRAFGALTALGIAALLIVGLFAPSTLDAIYKTRSSVGNGTFTRSATTQAVTAGPLFYRTSKLEIKYPSEMRENETAIVKMIYSARSVKIPQRKDENTTGTDVPPVTELDSLDAELGIRLTSSGFRLEPKEGFKRTAGSPLPIVEKWTITPEGEGKRFLLLRVEESPTSLEKFLQREQSVEVSINGEPSSPGEGGWFELPVNITTY